MKITTDVDIDLADRDRLLAMLEHTPARQDVKKHNTGVYFHEVPIDPATGWCAVNYKQAEDLGYFKIDMLNVGLYKDVKTPEHLDQLMAKEPNWDLLDYKEIVEQLFHINNHFDVVQRMKPTNIEQLAAVLAIIRPAKRYLLGLPWDRVMREVWIRPENDEYFFKKAHAIAYAHAIVVQLNLLEEAALGIRNSTNI